MNENNEIRSGDFKQSDRTNAIQDDDTESSLTQMNFVDDDFASWFETRGGKELINIKVLATAFDKSEHSCIKIVTKNVALFIGDHFEFTSLMDVNSKNALNPKIGVGRHRKDHYLTRNGCLMFIAQLDYNRYENERKDLIVLFKRWLVTTAGDVIDGKSASENLFFDPANLKNKPKEIAKDNNLRRTLFVKKVREAHPSSPNTFRRLNELAHNDQQLIEGSQTPFQQGWHKRLSKARSLKDHAQKLASFAAIACGHLEISEINRFERELFKSLPEQYLPEYLIQRLDTTRQAKLLEEGSFYHPEVAL